MRILVVDDDRSVRDALRRALTLAGYEVQMAEGGQQALTQAATAVPDAVVLDIGMPDIDGLEVCRRLRGAGNRVPILMLTARDAVADRIDGLDAGADDYLVKPFDVGELKARLRALMRRSNGEGDPDALSFGELKLDSSRHGVMVGEDFAELTRTEYQLLELLMLNPRRVLPHGLIYDRVWGYDFGPASNALRVYVGYLRRKLEEMGAGDLIHTVRGARPPETLTGAAELDAGGGAAAGVVRALPVVAAVPPPVAAAGVRLLVPAVASAVVAFAPALAGAAWPPALAARPPIRIVAPAATEPVAIVRLRMRRRWRSRLCAGGSWLLICEHSSSPP